MHITHRVKNSRNQTCGFLVDQKYYTCHNVLSNADLFDNVKITDGNVVEATDGYLPIVKKSEVNAKLYQTLAGQNPLVRDVQEEFLYWKTYRSSMVLYVTGARQVGKTTELLKFAYKNYEQIVYVNLAQPGVIDKFEKYILNNDIYFGMVRYCRAMKLEEFENSRNTILIVDEIQESSSIYNSIRALQNSLDCDVAVTGSYLGKTLNARYFKPAGNIWTVELLPLSFSEFCGTFGLRETLETLDIHGKDASWKYQDLYQLYTTYVQIGGYPSVVSEYKENPDVESCIRLIQKLIETFTEESEAYFADSKGKSKIVFENVYKEAFRSIAYEKKGTSSKDIETITGFIKESTKEHVSRSEVNKAVSWLKYSNIIGSCDLYNQGEVSQVLHERRFYFMDCGLANCIAKMTPVDNQTVKGILTENFAYTELYRLCQKDMVKGDKPCCSVYNDHELDFMIVDRNDIKYGLEIKSSDQDQPVSLAVYLKDNKIDKGYLAGKTRGGVRKNIYSIPIYTVGCRFPYERGS